MDHTSIKKKLIKLFAAHSTLEIEADDGALLKKALGVQKYRKFLQYPDDTFKKYYFTLKDLREKLDDAQAKWKTSNKSKDASACFLPPGKIMPRRSTSIYSPNLLKRAYTGIGTVMSKTTTMPVWT